MSTAAPSIWDQAEKEQTGTGSVWDQAAGTPVSADKLPGATPLLRQKAAGLSPNLIEPTSFEKDRTATQGDFNRTQEEGYRRAYAKEGERGGIVLTDADVAMLGLGGMGTGKAIAQQGIKAAGKGLARTVLGGAAGGAAGGYAGKEIGSVFGKPEEGRQIGAGLGGIAGGYIGGVHPDVLPSEGRLGGLFDRVRPAPAAEFPGASMPSADEFYAKRGAEINSMRRLQPEAFAGPEPELGSPENPGFHAKLPTRMPKPVAQKSPVASPFAGMTPSTAPAGDIRLPEIGGQAAPAANVPGITPTAAPSPVAAPTLEAAKAPVVKLPEPRKPLPGENPNYNASIPRARLLDLGRQGRPGAGDQLRNIGKTVLYVPPEGYPGPRPEVAPPNMETAGATSPVAPPNYAYRAHTTGEQGIDLNAHAHATMSPEEAEQYAQYREGGVNQKVSKIDLSKENPEDYVLIPGPNGNTWVKFKKQPGRYE